MELTITSVMGNQKEEILVYFEQIKQVIKEYLKKKKLKNCKFKLEGEAFLGDSKKVLECLYG